MYYSTRPRQLNNPISFVLSRYVLLPESNLSHTFSLLLCHGSYLPFIDGHVCKNGHIFVHKLKKKRLSPPHQGLFFINGHICKNLHICLFTIKKGYRHLIKDSPCLLLVSQLTPVWTRLHILCCARSTLRDVSC